MSIGAHLLGLAMFAAGPVTGQKGQILIAHDEMDRCLGNNSPNLHSVPGGEIGRTFAGQAQAAGKNGNHSKRIGMRSFSATFGHHAEISREDSILRVA